MNGRIEITTLIALIAAVVIFWMLRNALGRRTGDEAGRFERYKQERAAQQARIEAAGKDKVVKLPRRDQDQSNAQPLELTEADEAARNQLMTRFAAGNAELAKGLIEVARHDPSFDPKEFMEGAKSAYEMIVMAFAEGNRALLSDLLSPEVFEGFVAVIDDRQSRNETVEQSFVGIKASEMTDADTKGSWAQITVRFVSELITATRNAAGEIIAGDDRRIREVTDVWTFARDTSSENPNWRLIATQGAA